MISSIICAQNNESTIFHCVSSFLKFCEEVIVVVNNSTDTTWDIVNDNFSSNERLKKVQVQGNRDLSGARQVGFSLSSQKWVIRADGDFVCYDSSDGKFNAHRLLDLLSDISFQSYPTLLTVPQLNIFNDITTCGDGTFAFSPYDEPCMPRIYSRNPLLTFRRLGRDEGVPFMRFYKKVRLSKPLWCHFTKKSKVDIRLSHSWRRDWRQLGDYKLFPTLVDYVNNFALPKYYPGLSLQEASDDFYSKFVAPSLANLPKDSKWPVPKSLL